MTSARTHCPDCQSARVAVLNAILFAPNADFFRCEECGFLWHVQKGEDGPASRSLLGTAVLNPPPASMPVHAAHRARAHGRT